MIIHFETEGSDSDKDFKVNWKDTETQIKTNFNRLKIVYSRAD